MILVAGPAEGGVAAVTRAVVRELRAGGEQVVHSALPDAAARRAGPAWRGIAAAWRLRRELRAAEVAHLEVGRGSLAAFWFGLAGGLLRGPRGLVLVAHDPPHVVRAPGAGLLRTAPGWRDAVAHRVLAPLLDRPLHAALRRRVAGTVVLSEQAAAQARRDRWPAVSVLEHGADPPSPDAPPPSRGGHVLMAGYLGPGKGLDVLARAWREIGAPPVPLVIAGRANRQDQPWLAAVRRQFDGCPAPVDWLGYVSDERFARLVATAAVVVLPYTSSNPASGVLVRALVEGRPVVATRVPAALAEIEPGRTGLLVDVGDPAALAAALRRLLERPGLRDELGAAAARQATVRHTWARHVAQLKAAYRGEHDS